jgi:hypothetical protein
MAPVNARTAIANPGLMMARGFISILGPAIPIGTLGLLG